MPFAGKFLALSLRQRLGLGLAVVVFPLLVLTLLGYLLFYYAVEMMDSSYENFDSKFIPVSALQETLLRAVMPPNDYLIHGDKAEIRNFAALRAEVDEGFKRVLAVDFENPRMNASVIKANEIWQEAVQLGEELLSLEISGDKHSGGRKMEQMDQLVEDAYDQLEYVCVSTVADIHNKHLLIHEVNQKVAVALVGFMILLSIVVFVGSVLIKRWIIAPLQVLENGAQELAAGHMEHRIPVTSSDEIGSVARTFNDMASAISRDRDVLYELTIRDPLTGLLNRKEYKRHLELEIARSLRNGRPLAVMMIDIDHFKAINDRHGHQAGDAVLRAVAERILTALRPNDIVARYGGEEFIVILPDTEAAGAILSAERLCEQVRETPFDISGNIQIRVTVSVGAAEYPRDADSVAGITEAADQAMYGAKAAGRDRMLCYVSLPKSNLV